MRYWWVNQNQTYSKEIRGNFMWSPKANSHGHRNPFDDFMREVTPGDVVFSFKDTLIKAVGVVAGHAQTAPKPDFGTAGNNWSEEGWFVPVTYCGFELLEKWGIEPGRRVGDFNRDQQGFLEFHRLEIFKGPWP